MFPPLSHLARLRRTIFEWPVASQQQARRNAMVALTACARRRAEREEVASYLAARAAGGDLEPAIVEPDPRVAAHA